MGELLPVRRWLELLSHPPEVLRYRLRQVYERDNAQVAAGIGRYLRLMREFARLHGDDRRVLLVRAPGRVNLLGMHVEHQGGSINALGIRETALVVAPRQDDIVSVRNLAEEVYPWREFSIERELPGEEEDDWPSWTAGKYEELTERGEAGDWVNYAKAAVLYLQQKCRGEKRLKGMDVLLTGDVPPAAGLSSSSSLVVAFVEAVNELNGLGIGAEEMVVRSGEAEYYVGTRGGMGDQAAIKLARAGEIAHLSFFPLGVRYVGWPVYCEVVVCHSGVEAKKAAGARDVFNQRTATYRIGLMLFRKRCAEHATTVEHLRDINAARLGIEETEIYEIIRALPASVSREELRREVGGDGLAELFKTHAAPADGYKVRQVCLYGLAEMARSAMAANMLADGDSEGFGELMRLSHNGDRVQGEKGPGALTPEAGLPLHRQVGGYDVSCPQVDELVDLALAMQGVIGARMIGGGLGGCVAVLVESGEKEALIAKLEKEYYGRKRITPLMEVCRPVGGAGVIEAE